jgi:hypothetical protein
VKPRPFTAVRSTGRRIAVLAVLACVAVALAACSATGESSSEQLPIGPKPSITVLLRVGDNASTTVQLLGTGTTQGALDVAAGAVATAAFPNAQVGPPQQATDSDAELTVATVPVQLTTDAMTFDLSSDGMAAALKSVHPKALGVWVCTDDRRSLSVDSTAPGAVSSDIVSGQCQVAGSTLAHEGEGGTWTATVSIGAVEPPSKLPWLIAAAVVVALIAGAVWLLRARRDKPKEPIIGPPLPPAPPVH